jgi:ubiquitin-protein ligase E3 C
MAPKESDTLVRAVDEDEESSGNVAPSLHPFIREQLLSLVNQTSISGLLNKFNGDQTKGSISQEEDASLLSSYALTLLRIFPGRGDEIRMWLFQGSMTTSSGIQLPALKFFWQATSGTKIFSAIKEDSKAALNLLRPQTQSNALTPSQNARDYEWRTILLFLELYNFVLRFTDDEEFLSAGNITLGDQAISRFRESALPLKDIRSLTIFLKNLAFTAFYNASELLDDDQSVANDSPRVGSLGTYFGSTTTSIFQSQPQSSEATRQTFRPFAGIAGMNFPYVRTIVTGVMRMLYERDSRRRFLPKDHWLMTSRFDMEGFIPAVVAEEERLHEYHEEGDDGEEEDEVADEDECKSILALISFQFRRSCYEILYFCYSI